MDGKDNNSKPATGDEAESDPAAVPTDEPTAEAPPEAEEAAPESRLPRDSSGDMIAVEVAPVEEEQAPTVEDEADLREELDKKQNQLLRMAADFDNYRKRSRRDAQDAAFRAKKDVLESILPVIDNLELALSHAAQKQDGCGDAETLREGVEMVLRQFTTAMEKFDIRPMESLGQAFDPSFHEALQQRESDEHPPGAIVEEYRRGYMMGDRLLRAAMVVVAVAPAAPPSEDAAEADTAAPDAPASEGAAEESGSGEDGGTEET